METTIYIIRHAQSRQSKKVFHSEWPLSDVGSRQAQELSALIHHLPIEHVISSPFVRCLDTIKPFVDRRSVPMAVHDDLRERYITDVVVDNFQEIWLQSWRDFNYKLPGCESSAEAKSRFAQAMDQIVTTHSGKTIGVSTHGNVIGLFLHHIDPSNHIEAAENLRNPDVLRIVHKKTKYFWDRDFKLPGLDDIATHHSKTPVDR